MLKRRRKDGGSAPRREAAAAEETPAPIELDVGAFKYVRSGPTAVVWVDGSWPRERPAPSDVTLVVEAADGTRHAFGAAPEVRAPAGPATTCT
jgi:hypothetical protein